MTKDRMKMGLLVITFFLLAFCGSGAFASLPVDKGMTHEYGAQRVFIINAPIRGIAEFRQLVIQAARLKPYGKVEVNISALADKGFHEIPEGNNFWYEYASYNPTLFKFFPDKKIAPFIPAEFVKKNREYLLARVKILREYGLGAAFWCNEPNFLPDEFFEAYPHLRGPRVDHPRRSNHPAFSLCMDLEESREMVSEMIDELIKNVPEINTFSFKTNDAGSGICWSDWQYSGPNGPSHCRDIPMGKRVASIMNLYNEAAARAGKKISVYLAESMFSDEEMEDILKNLPENCYAQGTASDNSVTLGSGVSGFYPVKGLFDPVELLNRINQIKAKDTKTVFLSFRSYYDRCHEVMPVIEKVTDIVIQNLQTPVFEGEIEEMQKINDLCIGWAGENNAKKMFDALMLLEEAKKYKNYAVGNVTGIYWGVSARHINRPLVAAPQLLTKEEEVFFLPHVFNPSVEEARMDYTDIHGSHNIIQPATVKRYISMITRAASLMESIDRTAPESSLIDNMAKALRIHASIMRSAGNFAEAQAVRDRNAEKLSLPPHRPDKIPTWEGDPDLQVFNTAMRDELDNTQQLIELLQSGGMDLICHATDLQYEDTFVLGPDLIRQLKLKMKVMLRHWTDIEKYMATPFK